MINISNANNNINVNINVEYTRLGSIGTFFLQAHKYTNIQIWFFSIYTLGFELVGKNQICISAHVFRWNPK